MLLSNVYSMVEVRYILRYSFQWHLSSQATNTSYIELNVHKINVSFFKPLCMTATFQTTITITIEENLGKIPTFS